MTQISVDYHGLTIKGELIEKAWTGDPDVPDGVDELPPCVDELRVFTPDGYDITEEFCDLERLEAYAIKEVLG